MRGRRAGRHLFVTPSASLALPISQAQKSSRRAATTRQTRRLRRRADGGARRNFLSLGGVEMLEPLPDLQDSNS
jgi:hypothetical protein